MEVNNAEVQAIKKENLKMWKKPMETIVSLN